MSMSRINGTGNSIGVWFSSQTEHNISRWEKRQKRTVRKHEAIGVITRNTCLWRQEQEPQQSQLKVTLRPLRAVVLIVSVVFGIDHDRTLDIISHCQCLSSVIECWIECCENQKWWSSTFGVWRAFMRDTIAFYGQRRFVFGKFFFYSLETIWCCVLHTWVPRLIYMIECRMLALVFCAHTQIVCTKRLRVAKRLICSTNAHCVIWPRPNNCRFAHIINGFCMKHTNIVRLEILNGNRYCWMALRYKTLEDILTFE